MSQEHVDRLTIHVCDGNNNNQRDLTCSKSQLWMNEEVVSLSLFLVKVDTCFMQSVFGPGCWNLPASVRFVRVTFWKFFWIKTRTRIEQQI